MDHARFRVGLEGQELRYAVRVGGPRRDGEEGEGKHGDEEEETEIHFWFLGSHRERERIMLCFVGGDLDFISLCYSLGYK